MIQKKVVLLGAPGVGKTSLVRRFVQHLFDDTYLTTIGVTIEKKLVVVDGQDVAMMLWDLAGAEGPFGVPPSYVRGAAGFVLVADGTRPETLDIGRDLRRDLRAALGGVPGVLVLNKHDLTDAWRVPDLGADDDGDPILMTSAKTGNGVDAMFLRLAERTIRTA